MAEAITSGNPQGGNEIVQKAKEYGWLAENASENEILEAQRRMAESGFFVEPAAAASLVAVKKLVHQKQIAPDAVVVLMLTGSGLKDMSVFNHHTSPVFDTSISRLETILGPILKV